MSQTATNPFNDFVFINASQADRGSFTVALDKALDKLEKFQLPEPSYFILQWMQALVAAGSQSIDVLVARSPLGFRLTIDFDGPGYTARELQTLYDHVFLSGRDRTVDRLRELALGWLSASSLKPTRLMISSNGCTRLRDKTETNGKDEIQHHEESLTRHRLEISGRGSYDFEEMITSRCGDVPIPLLVNGSQVSHPGVSSGLPWPNRPFTNGPSHGVMGATYGVDSVSHIAFLRHGVNFVSRAEPALVPSVMIRVSDPTLSKNVSQTDVVKDDAYEDFLGRIRLEMKTMGLALTKKRIPSYQRDSLNRYLQAFIASHLDIRALEDPKRIQQLGPDFESLMNFPVFCASKGVFYPLSELHRLYKSQGFLVYCLDAQARSTEWAGVLLVLEVEEVAVLRKFFPNLIGLSLEQVRSHSRTGRSVSGAYVETSSPTLAVHQFESSGRKYRITIEDAYPTGIAVLRASGSRLGTAISSLPLSMTVDFFGDLPPSHTEAVGLRQTIIESLEELKSKLRGRLKEVSQQAAISRPRAAELLCEILNFELASTENESQLLRFIELDRWVPLIGLEDGRHVSLADIEVYLKHIPQLYVGGAFIDGLASGALDPMPQAARLLARLFPSQCLVPTERIHAKLRDDEELRFALRRQVVVRGIATATNPQNVLQQFATEAAREAAEIAELEKEYRKTIEGDEKLFVQPDPSRLEALTNDSDEDSDFPLFDLTATPELSSPQASPASSSSPVKAAVPSLESDLEFCRLRDPDLLPDRDSVHVERRELEFSYHLATLPSGDGKIYLLSGERFKELAVPEPVRGVLRLASGASIDFRQLYDDALEQLTVRTIHSFQAGVLSARTRKSYRNWLLRFSCLRVPRLKIAEERRNDLFDQPVIPCLGGKHLSWRSLLEQAQRSNETLTWNGAPHETPCPNREVLRLEAPLTAPLLQSLGFPKIHGYSSKTPEQGFDTLYRSTRRDLASILSGQSTPLLSPGTIEQLASDASLWKRWRSGFLSWDKDQEVVVMNPSHKVGKQLTQKFAQDPAWSQVFASALFSTVNRGLDEVDDRHERAFLASLLQTLD